MIRIYHDGGRSRTLEQHSIFIVGPDPAFAAVDVDVRGHNVQVEVRVRQATGEPPSIGWTAEGTKICFTLINMGNSLGAAGAPMEVGKVAGRLLSFQLVCRSMDDFHEVSLYVLTGDP